MVGAVAATVSEQARTSPVSIALLRR